MPPLWKRAVLYELYAMVLVFLVSWAWTRSLPRASGLTVVLFVTLTAYYYVFHSVWPGAEPS